MRYGLIQMAALLISLPIEMVKVQFFLPDSTLTYKGRPRDNIRKALTNDPSVLRLIQKHKELFDLRLKYDKKGVAEIPYAEVLRIEEKIRTSNFTGQESDSHR